MLEQSPIEVDISGRATGKSSKRASRIREIVETLPGSCNMIVTRTYKTLLEDTLSPTCEALERLGKYQDVHYVIGKTPPKGWPVSSRAPKKDFENYWSWRNGAGWKFHSQDVAGSKRGSNVDSLEIDEALNIDRAKFEIGASAANRGNLKQGIGNYLHHGINITSSMPTTAAGQWLLDYGNYYEEDGNNYWLLWNKITRL